MTLIEVLVGVTIVALALTAGYGAFAAVLDSRERAARTVDPMARSMAARRTLATWLSNARVTGRTTDPPFTGTDAGGGGAGDQLTFLATAAPPFSDGTTLVRFFIDVDPATAETGLVAELTEWGGRRSGRMALAPTAAGMDVRYLDRASGQPAWVPEWLSSVQLPAAVELRVLLSAADSLAPILEVPVLVPLAAGR